MAATYTKLRTGDWGVRIEGTAAVGSAVTVTRRDGQTKTETISRVVWSGGGVTLCAVEPTARPATQYARSGGYRSREHHCEACEWNQDAGDMNGCPRHRGNPRD